MPTIINSLSISTLTSNSTTNLTAAITINGKASGNATITDLYARDSDKLDGVHPISEISERMIASINGEEIAYARRENMKHLWSLLNGKIRMIHRLEKSFDGAPFSLPILVENRDAVQKQLAQKGVYAPVLWPVDGKARNTCEVSAYVSDHMLSIPIDQRYNYDDIEDIASIILSIIK